MLQAMYSGVSGLTAFAQQIDVIGNNISNVNTVGFKASSVVFRDVFSQTLRGATPGSSEGIGGLSPEQIGMGVAIGGITMNTEQGALQSTGRPTDCAIQGDGFFIMSDGVGKFYSRDGSLSVDSDGNLVSTASGYKLLGWMAGTDGTIDSTAGVTAQSAIRVPMGTTTVARQTSTLAYGGNLSADSPVGETYNVSSDVYDSLGMAHPLKVAFTHDAATGTWTWTATSPDAAAGSTVGSGTAVFDTSGRNSSGPLQFTLNIVTNTGAATAIPLTVDMTGVTLTGAASNLSTTAQNGFPPGLLNGYSIGENGLVSGSFTNGMQKVFGQIALASFANPSGLMKLGSNLLSESANSGIAQVGRSAVDGLGTITSGYLEASNVDLSKQFTEMIIAQRAFQANSRIITTSDEMMQELVQLKR